MNIPYLINFINLSDKEIAVSSRNFRIGDVNHVLKKTHLLMHSAQHLFIPDKNKKMLQYFK